MKKIAILAIAFLLLPAMAWAAADVGTWTETVSSERKGHTWTLVEVVLTYTSEAVANGDAYHDLEFGTMGYLTNACIIWDQSAAPTTGEVDVFLCSHCEGQAIASLADDGADLAGVDLLGMTMIDEATGAADDVLRPMYMPSQADVAQLARPGILINSDDLEIYVKHAGNAKKGEIHLFFMLPY